MSYHDKHIAIVGFDIEGKSSFRLVSKDEVASITVFDDNERVANELPEGVDFGGQVDNDYSRFDLVFRTPGVRPDRLQNVAELTSATIEFFEHCPAKIIGVTGTKGKGTTATLIAKILESAGNRVHLVGNIGQPALDDLDNIQAEDIVVFELSSFQLWDMKQSPNVAVVLAIGVDHMDVHNIVEEYISAKANIAAHQTQQDTVVYLPKNKNSTRIANQSPANKLPYFSQSDGAWLNDEDIMIGQENLMPVSEVGLIGPHNLENICAAVSAASIFTDNKSAIISAVKSFTGLEHRLEFVAQVNGVKFYNDSFSTTPEAAIAALNSFKVPTTIILGGSSKGANFSELIAAVKSAPNLNKTLLIGEEGNRLAELLSAEGFENYEVVQGDMKTIVSRSAEVTPENGVVVLSPACASFDMFINYKDRGQQFKESVKELQ